MGKLAAFTEKHGQFWAKDLSVGGTKKPANFEKLVDEGTAAFWAKLNAIK